MGRFFLAGSGLACALCLGLAFAWSAQAQSRPAKKDQTAATPEPGKDWRALRDGLDSVFEELQALNGLKPSPTCDDETFLRRVYLDLLGVPPSPAEVAAFAPGRKDAKGRRGQEKREALVEDLLRRPEYARNFAEYWRVQTIGRDKGREINDHLEQYFQRAFAENRPWDRVVRELVTAAGKTPENPEVAYLVSFENERADIAGTTMRVFLGKQIQCAQCHDHPYEEWKTDDFVGLQGFFALSASGAKGDGADRYWFVNDNPMPANGHELSARLRLPGRHKLPKYLGGDLYKFDRDKTLRQSLAHWMTDAENRWFREMTVNRMMAYFLGLGFVNPVDDFNSVNEPSVPVVLEVMGKDFAAAGFDLHYLVKAITTSKLYQRTAQPTRYNRKDRVYYSRFFVRKQSPEQLYRSVLKVSGIEELNPYQPVRDVPDDKLSEHEKANKLIRDRVMGYKNSLAMYFRGAYGSDEPEKAFDDYSGSIMQALLLMNFPLLGDGNLKTSLSEILARTRDGKTRVELIYQTVLGRNPTQREWAILRGVMASWPDNDTAYEDLFLALMNTTEFATVG
ncbi:MAG: DUF1549 domain-containing protein [Planctomycetes bacterium]|jgi:hypothetical protein|nr:DUF1549 domain-containing protein [Planctomycetota bacterium]MCL4730573.1 DUF1549 domain-containing protein [Planctomycetota bacterium]